VSKRASILCEYSCLKHLFLGMDINGIESPKSETSAKRANGLSSWFSAIVPAFGQLAEPR
jgi:hypothetical protein